MPGDRPAPDQLVRVAGAEYVFRLVHPSWYKNGHLESACLQSKDWKGKPSATDYGPSVFVVSRLPATSSRMHADIAALLSANPSWERWGLVEIPVNVLEEQGLVVRLTPMDCRQFPALKDAHATLLGVTSENRDVIVESFDQHVISRGPHGIVRAPQR